MTTHRKSKAGKGVNTPLSCKLIGNEIVIRIGIGTLSYAAAMHPDFYDGESGDERPNIKVDDKKMFAKDVERELNAEQEDGTTPVDILLDNAMKMAVENGSAAIDSEHLDENNRRRYDQ